MILYEHRTSMMLKHTTAYSCIPHLHRYVEIVYIESGCTVAKIDQTEYRIREGHVAIAFPLQIHCYFDQTAVKGHLLICDPDEFPDLAEIFATRRPEYPICVAQDTNINKLFQAAVEAQKSDMAYKNEIVKGYVQIILSETLERLNLREHEPTDMNMVEKILNYCDNEYMHEISLDTLSKKVGASKYHVSRIFSTKIKISFNDYINTLRVNASKRLLKHTSYSIERISEEVGFSTVRSYNREFKRVFGVTPSEYRKKKAN